MTPRLWLSPTGAMLALIGFFLPWFQISCQPNRTKPPIASVQFTGYQLATGTRPPKIQALFDSFFTGTMIKMFLKRLEAKRKRKLDLFPKRWLLWGTFGASLLALFLGLLILGRIQQHDKTHPPTAPPRWLSYGGILSVLLAFGFLIAGLLQHMPPGTGSKSRIPLPESIVFCPTIGAFLLLGGLLLALVGFWPTQKQAPPSTPHSQEPTHPFA